MQNLPESDSPQPILVLVERLNDSLGQYRSELKRTRKDFSEEYIHDLRVAIRRLIAAIDMARAIVHKKKTKKSRRLLKSHLDSFDMLRDTQVQLVIVDELQAEFPEIVIYRDRLRQREKKLIVRLEKKVKEFHSGGLSRQVAGLSASLLDNNIPEDAIWSVIDDSYTVVIQRQSAVRAEDTATIHRTRVAFKKLRYQVESVHTLLPNAPEDLLRRLHEYQAAMGDIQDVEVGLEMLDDFIAWSGEALPVVQARFAEMRQARIAAFIDQMDTLQTFWRPESGEAFPWESKI